MRMEFVLSGFDGVITNTKESNAVYLEKTLSASGIQLTDDDRKALINTNDKVRIESPLFRSLAKVMAEDLAGRRRQVENTYENSYIRPMQGVVSLTQETRGQGMKTGLVTSISTRLIMIALSRARMVALSDVVICDDMCTDRKSDPEYYKKVTDYLGAEPCKCIVFEDSAVGMHAARSAGARVATCHGSGVQQDAGEADLIVDSYDECKDMLDDIMQGRKMQDRITQGGIVPCKQSDGGLGRFLLLGKAGSVYSHGSRRIIIGKLILPAQGLWDKTW